MKSKQANTTDTSGANWQVLGNLALAIDSDAESTINPWLTALLSPLNLHTDFQNKVLRSAVEAAARAVQAETAKTFEHIHLLIFAPTNHKSEGQTWGFFRIEKIENANPDKEFPDHAIELYLYMEGE